MTVEQSRSLGRAGGSLVCVMFDPARMLFRKEWYTRWLPDLAAWGYNALMLNLADENACTIELHRRPELTSPHAFSQDEMRRLIRAADGHGIAVIPMMPSFGHTGYIHKRSRYRHLRNGHGRAHLCPAHPETYEVLADILEEVTALFPASWVHAGLDEFGTVPDPACERCSKRFAQTPRWRIYVDHVRWLHEFLGARHRRMMIWNEFPEGNWKQSDVAEALPKDVALTLEYDDPDKTRFYLDHGFGVVRAFPYLTSYPGTTIVPNEEQNMTFRPWSVDPDRYKDRMLGSVVPVWQNTYNLFGAPLYGIARAADRIAHGPDGSPGFAQRFCEAFFGMKTGAGSAGDLLERLHREALQVRWFEGLNNLPLAIRNRAVHLLNLFGADDANELTAEEIAYGAARADHAAHVAAALRRARSAVRRNRRFYDVYILAADLIEHIGRRGALMRDVAGNLRAARAATHARAARGLRKRALKDARRAARDSRRLTERMYRNWDLGYYPDHPGRTPVASGPGTDQGLGVDVSEPMRPEGTLERVHLFRGGNQNAYASMVFSTHYLERMARALEGVVTGDREIAPFGEIPKPVEPPPPVTPFVCRWRVSAGLRAPADFTKVPFPDATVVGTMSERTFPKGWCDLRETEFACAPEDVMVYLRCTMRCPAPMDVLAGLGYDGPVKVWFDGDEVFRDPAGARPMGTDKAQIPLPRGAGAHELTVALGSDRGRAWGMRLRFRRVDVSDADLRSGAYELPVVDEP